MRSIDAPGAAGMGREGTSTGGASSRSIDGGALRSIGPPGASGISRRGNSVGGASSRSTGAGTTRSRGTEGTVFRPGARQSTLGTRRY